VTCCTQSLHASEGAGVPEFTETLEVEVLPLLRKQKGFRDEITFVAPEEEAFWHHLWDQAENAESYNRGALRRSGEALAKVIDGNSQVETL